MATGDAAPTLMRDTLYSIIMIVTGGLVGFSLLLGGRKFATQYMNLFGIKQYLIALFPGDNRTGISNGSACGEFFNRSGVTGSINFCGNVWRILLIRPKRIKVCLSTSTKMTVMMTTRTTVNRLPIAACGMLSG